MRVKLAADHPYQPTMIRANFGWAQAIAELTFPVDYLNIENHTSPQGENKGYTAFQG
jgi:hypothetical protein